MEFDNLVLEAEEKQKFLSYSKNLKIQEFFYSKKIKNEYLSVLYLVNIQFWKSRTFPFFAFIFPVFFIGILGKMLGYENMFANVLSISSTSIGLIALPTSILEFKNSILLKRIGITKISPTTFIMIVFIFYFVIMFIGTIFTVILSICLFYGNWHGKELTPGVLLGREKQMISLNIPSLFKNGIELHNRIFAPPFKTFFQNANWFGVFYGYTLNCLLSLVIGVIITSFSKSLMALQALAVPIMVISNFLSGQVLPLNLIISNPDLWNISYITPFKYTNNIIIESFNGNPKSEDIKNTYLDLTQLATTIKSDSFKNELKKADSNFEDSTITKIINYLTQGTYDSSTSSSSTTGNSSTKYEWLNGNGTNVSSSNNKIVQITEDVPNYIKNFLLNFVKATQKANTNLLGLFTNIFNTLTSYFGFSTNKSTITELNVTSPVIETYKVVGIEQANPFDIFKPFQALNLTNDKIMDIISKTEKILNNSLIYVWISGLLMLGIYKFKWSNR